jgi:hypothetical protein
LKSCALIALLTLCAPSIILAQNDSTSRSIILRTIETANASSDSENSNVDTTNIHPVRFGIVTGTAAAAIAGVHIYQANGWWKDNRTSFHFQEDLKYGLSVDKYGHFFGTSVASFLLRKSLRWSGLSEDAALYWGAGGALAYQAYLEVEDGLHTWGFDRVDFACDVAGAAWPIAQHHSPFLRNFDFKYSYLPSAALNSGNGEGFQGQQHTVFDDYEGQTLWMSLKMKNLLPGSINHLWPEFLCISVGYAVRDVFGKEPRSAVLLALDLDMTRVIPNDTPFLKLLGEALNFIKFPMPTVQLSPKTIWYGFYF